MNSLDRSSPRALMCAFLLVLLIPVSGCAGEVERRWSEEVKLDDGSIIVVERYVKFQSSNALGGGAYSSTDLVSKLAFTDALSKLPTWDVTLVPLVLYRGEKLGEWVIVATTSNCDTWYTRGGPIPPYWEFRVQDAKWVESKLTAASIGRKTNLFFNYEAALPAKKISLEMKDHIVKSENFGEKYLAIEGGLKSKCGYAPPPNQG